MRKTVLALTFLLAAGPSLAGGLNFDLPRLTWPTNPVVTESTKGCSTATDQATTAPVSCQH